MAIWRVDYAAGGIKPIFVPKNNYVMHTAPYALAFLPYVYVPFFCFQLCYFPFGERINTGNYTKRNYESCGKVSWKEIGLKDKKTIKSYAAAWTRTTARQTTVSFIFITLPR